MKPVIILGGGGHARVVYRLCEALKIEVLGFAASETRDYTKKHKVFHSDDEIFKYNPTEIWLANGIGDLAVRRRLFDKFVAPGFRFPTLVHPSAFVETDAVLESGVQVMAGAVVQAGAKIGFGTIINTKASVDHDSTIGAYCHIAPGSTICGEVTMGDESFVAAGSILVPQVKLAAGCFVGAGSVVTQSFAEKAKLIGRPARALTL